MLRTAISVPSFPVFRFGLIFAPYVATMSQTISLTHGEQQLAVSLLCFLPLFLRVGLSLLVGGFLGFLVLIEEVSTNKPDTSANAGTECGVTCDRAERGARCCAADGPATDPLFRIAHARAAGDKEKAHSRRHGDTISSGSFSGCHRYLLSS
jgi:hypothetical protein